MEYERFVYPDYDEPTVSAFDCAFEAAYIVLHPFLRLPGDLASHVDGYPDDEQIVMAVAKCAWTLVGEQLGFSSYSKLDQALLTSSRAIKDEICDYDASALLEKFLETNSIWKPANGGFDPLLRADYLSAFDITGQPELVAVPEFPQLDKTERHAVCDLRSGAATFPHRGTLVSADCSFLFTVDWDSFFTLMFGPRALLERIVGQRNMEGFFATRSTKHFWFKDAAESTVPK